MSRKSVRNAIGALTVGLGLVSAPQMASAGPTIYFIEGPSEAAPASVILGGWVYPSVFFPPLPYPLPSISNTTESDFVDIFAVFPDGVGPGCLRCLGSLSATGYLLEDPVSRVISDLVHVSAHVVEPIDDLNNDVVWEFTFDFHSDSDVSPLGVLAPNIPFLLEDGTVQLFDDSVVHQESNSQLSDFGISLYVQSDAPEQVRVPEPSTLALFGAGLLGLGALRRRRMAKT
jgi:hypothetical protein